ncbi:transcription factor E2F6 isoform X2 [Vulpes vulpes]|uniref:Transcription factor E2F6 isoform X2 n=1 Tax=Vulpes vulpes TaxID=9627 RepID=A0ABM5B9V1_VULVU
MREDGGPGVLRAAGHPARLRAVLAPQIGGAGGLRRVRPRAGPGSGASERAAGPGGSAPESRRVGGGARPGAGEGGRARAVRGAGRPAGQHESAAAGAEAAQPAGGPGGGDGAPPVPRPHQRGGPAGLPFGGSLEGSVFASHRCQHRLSGELVRPSPCPQDRPNQLWFHPPQQPSKIRINLEDNVQYVSMRKALKVKRPRFDVSLVYLTRKFMDLVRSAPGGILDLNKVATKLGVRKRRVYDITNVLDGIDLVEKKSKNHIRWIGSDLSNFGAVPQQKKLQEELSDLSAMEDALDELIKDCAQQLFELTDDKENERLAYVTYQDIHSIQAFHEQIVIAVKAPAETRLDVPAPREKKILHSKVKNCLK